MSTNNRDPTNKPCEYSPLLSQPWRHCSADAPGLESGNLHATMDRAKTYESTQTRTSISLESKRLLVTSVPLIITFLLEYSFTAASIFAVGHIGKVELAATAVASLTANITGYAMYQGLATGLDTVCPAAYGAGNAKLVGLYCQRAVCFLWTMTVPIGGIWLCAGPILKCFIRHEEVVELASLYLQILVLGAPGYAAFEVGKRFMMAQGLFIPTVWILCICAPFNAALNWLFVWKFNWGFIGAPISVVIVETLLPILLAAYVAFIDGSQCWGGFTRSAFIGWGPMISLALPCLFMVEAELLAFELITLGAGFISVDHLAAQSTVATLANIAFMFHFPISIAASTRVSTLVGAGSVDGAKVASRVAIMAGLAVGILVAMLLTCLRDLLSLLFTDNLNVAHLVAGVLPLVGVSQVFDSLATACNGILRGLGRQKIGGLAALFCYYLVAMPLAFGTAIGLHWELRGFAVGTAAGLMLVSIVEGIVIVNTDWEEVVEEIKLRNQIPIG